MKVGIVGFSQSGKSTLFQALTGVSPDPATALDGQLGIAKVHDPRLDHLSDLYRPKKTTPATVEFFDTPGLVRGKPEENPRRIATQRNADGLLVVLDCFSGSHASPAVQLAAFRDELFFADLEVVTARAERIRDQSKKTKPVAEREREAAEIAVLEQIAARLEQGQSVNELALTDEMQKMLKSFQLFSLKPTMVVQNCAESEVGTPADAELLKQEPHAIVTAAKLERDLGELEGEERQMFMTEMGVSELARDRIIQLAYDVVGLTSYFTVGEDECRAWTVRRGASAVEAAGVIHSDIARGFIRAEVFTYQDLFELGGEKEVRAKGRHRLEGKDYVVADGDIVEFRFNV